VELAVTMDAAAPEPERTKKEKIPKLKILTQKILATKDLDSSVTSHVTEPSPDVKPKSVLQIGIQTCSSIALCIPSIFSNYFRYGIKLHLVGMIHYEGSKWLLNILLN
jgi:hypothetical protein